MNILRLSPIILLGLGLAACSNPPPTPPPRSAALPSVPQTTPAGPPNAPYYTGADPDFQRGSTGARSSKGGGP